MHVLVTGGAGFIGSHLTSALLQEGHEVRVLDNLSTGSVENLTDMPIEFIRGDVADMEAVKTAVQGCQLVFHQAALVSVPKAIENPTLNHAANVTGTFNVFEASRQAGVQRVVYASSAAVYGNLPNLPKKESDPLAPVTPYAMAKRTSELMAAVYDATYNLELIGLRYMNVFGPRQDPSSPYSGVLSIFCRNVLARKPLIIFGDGEQTRDFVYVTDVVNANLLAAKANISQLTDSPVYNIGQGKETSLNQIVDMLSQITGTEIVKAYRETRTGDIKKSFATIDLAKEQLAFLPKTSLLDGLRETLDWFRAIGE